METLEKELAAAHQVVGGDLIKLYEKLCLMLDEDSIPTGSPQWESGDYEIAGTGLGQGGIDFSICVRENEPMPERIVELFFYKIDKAFIVEYEETDTYKHRRERNFRFHLRLAQKRANKKANK